ncbi:MAG: GNAT family N-acetyltransferase [Deltaproteobacteria bacterium]|nr:GNAT family N-acetyltransferase [Deltaproteobacteria bacterium]
MITAESTGTATPPLTARRPQSGIDLKSRLALIGLIDEQLRSKAARAPVLVDLFGELNGLIDATVDGSKINRLNLDTRASGFHIIEITSDSGANLGRMNLLYLNKPIACYYLVYVEVLPFFRKKGLGHRILSHFRGFLDEKGAVGILNNVIPRNDPTYAIYFKQAWEPIEQVVGRSVKAGEENFMVYIPPQLRKKNLIEPVRKLLMHLNRKRAAIEMRDNETMVKGALFEFKELNLALSAYFQPEIEKRSANPFMRFMFTRFASEFIRFRREIGELIGYTGGESTEQIELPKEIADLFVKNVAPKDLTGDTISFIGDRTVWMPLMRALELQPALAIEALPNLLQPRLRKWLKAGNMDAGHDFTIGDLMDLGYDPTRLKEITLDGEPFVLHRISRRMLPEYKEKQKRMEQLSLAMGTRQVMGAHLLLNKPLAVIQDMGNAYVLRRKIAAIGWDEAQEQIQQDPQLQRLNREMRLEQLLLATVRAAGSVLMESVGIEAKTVFEKFSWMISWDLEANRPRLFMDYSGPVFESIWIT